MAVSPELLYRLFEIEVKSATLSVAVDGGAFYIRISLAGNGLNLHLHHQVLPLQTKHSTPEKNREVTWSQRFILSVPESFISDESSFIFFTLVKARKLLSDVALGQASCAVRTMFPVAACLEYDDGGPWGTEYAEPEIQEQETFELHAAVEGAAVTRSSAADQFSAPAEVARLDFSVSAWRRYYPYELNLRGRLDKRFPIIDGGDKLGKFIVRWPTAATEFSLPYACAYFTSVNQGDWAMEFEELKDTMRRRRRHSPTAVAKETPQPPKVPRRLLCFSK